MIFSVPIMPLWIFRTIDSVMSFRDRHYRRTFQPLAHGGIARSLPCAQTRWDPAPFGILLGRGPPGRRSAQRLWTIGQWRDEVAAAGFTDLRVELHPGRDDRIGIIATKPLPSRGRITEVIFDGEKREIRIGEAAEGEVSAALIQEVLTRAFSGRGWLPFAR